MEKQKATAGVDYVGVAVCFCCLDAAGRVLMSKRSQTCRDERGTWEFGSGQLETKETPAEGVLREVKEEFSCNGEIIAQLLPRAFFREKDGIHSSWLLLPFVIKVDPNEVAIGEPKSIDELRWFTWDALPSPLHSDAPTIAESYKEALLKVGL